MGAKARILQKSKLVTVLGSNFTDKFDEGLKNVTFIDADVGEVIVDIEDMISIQSDLQKNGHLF